MGQRAQDGPPALRGGVYRRQDPAQPDWVLTHPSLMRRKDLGRPATLHYLGGNCLISGAAGRETALSGGGWAGYGANTHGGEWGVGPKAKTDLPLSLRWNISQVTAISPPAHLADSFLQGGCVCWATEGCCKQGGGGQVRRLERRWGYSRWGGSGLITSSVPLAPCAPATKSIWSRRPQRVLFYNSDI